MPNGQDLRIALNGKVWTPSQEVHVGFAFGEAHKRVAR